MPVFRGGYDFGNGQLTAGMQADALGDPNVGGGGAGGDLGIDSLLGTVLAERRRKEAMLAAQQERARGDAMRAQREDRNRASRAQGQQRMMQERAQSRADLAAQQGSLGHRMQEARALVPEQTAAQRGVSAIGGMTGRAYSDSMRQMQANTLAGVPQTTYTGFTDLVSALNQGGAGATAAAAGLQQQQNEMNSPERQNAAQQALAMRMYPGMFPPQQQKQ